jgi:hypothetical protein
LTELLKQGQYGKHTCILCSERSPHGR